MFLSHSTSRKVAGLFSNQVIRIFDRPNHTSSIMNLGFTQLLTEMSTRVLRGGKGWLVRKADKLTSISELIF
jgi:hypothetical protein